MVLGKNQFFSKLIFFYYIYLVGYYRVQIAEMDSTLTNLILE